MSRDALNNDLVAQITDTPDARPNQPPDLQQAQMQDATFCLIYNYLVRMELPDEELLARKVIVQFESYVVDNDLLFHFWQYFFSRKKIIEGSKK